MSQPEDIEERFIDLESRITFHERSISVLSETVREQQAQLQKLENQLESLVSNLLDNAVRHGAGEDVDVRVIDGQGGRALIVRDHGPPVSEEHCAKIFDRFYTTERARGGTGLGLSIVRAIAEGHGGRVAVSRHDRGLSFSVVLG